MKYTEEQLDAAALADLLNDAKCAERDAKSCPEGSSMRQSLLSYAAECRKAARKYKDGGAHRAVLTGETP